MIFSKIFFLILPSFSYSNVISIKSSKGKSVLSKEISVSKFGSKRRSMAAAAPTILSPTLTSITHEITPDVKYKNNLNYGRVSAGCRRYHPDYDPAVNSCTNRNLMGSICTTGENNEDHFKEKKLEITLLV